MPVRRITVSLPEAVASQFFKRVPSQSRSEYVAEAIASRLAAQNQDLIEACRQVNADRKLKRLEHEWDSLEDPIEEPWDDAGPR